MLCTNSVYEIFDRLLEILPSQRYFVFVIQPSKEKKCFNILFSPSLKFRNRNDTAKQKNFDMVYQIECLLMCFLSSDQVSLSNVTKYFIIPTIEHFPQCIFLLFISKNKVHLFLSTLTSSKCSIKLLNLSTCVERVLFNILQSSVLSLQSHLFISNPIFNR